MYDDDYDFDPDPDIGYFRSLDREYDRLIHRAGLHPMDPDALDEDDLARLEELEALRRHV